MHMPPNMRGHPNAAQQQNMQALLQAQDEQIARKLQAHYNHRAMHPSHVAGGHGTGGGSGGLAPVVMGGGGHGGGHRDPEREARHKARDEQLKMALEVNPEAFVSVPMLYVQCLLNNVPVKAFVDTGAQMTVMTLKCAQACNLVEMIDSVRSSSRSFSLGSGTGSALP